MRGDDWKWELASFIELDVARLKHIVLEEMIVSVNADGSITPKSLQRILNMARKICRRRA